MNYMRWMVALTLAFGGVACGDEDVGNGSGNGANGSNGSGNGSNGSNGAIVDAGNGGTVDAGNGGNGGTVDAGNGGNGSMDAGGEPDATGPVCEAPTSGFGTREGSNFSPFDGVTYCDGADFDFYSEADNYCDSSLTVLIRAAEWCGPCQAEATEIGNGVLDEYKEFNVRFLSVMDQNLQGGAPSAAACENWERVFRLQDADVDHKMLIDPAQEVSIYFPPGENGYPGNVIVNSEGVIVRRIIGFSQNLSGLKAALDDLLGR